MNADRMNADRMTPEDRLRLLRDDDRWQDEPFVLRPAPVRAPRSLAPLKWASVGVGIAAAFVALVFVGGHALVGESGGASSAGGSAGSNGAAHAAPATGSVVPWTEAPVDGTASADDGSSSKGSDPDDLSQLTATIALPATITAGSTLDYVVTLTDRGTAATDWSTCPVYSESLRTAGAATPAQSYRLNCASTGAMAPNASIEFAMRIAVPAGATGPVTVTWRLAGGASVTATGTVTP